MLYFINIYIYIYKGMLLIYCLVKCEHSAVSPYFYTGSHHGLKLLSPPSHW